MVGSVHIAVGAAVGAICIRPAARLQNAKEPLSIGNSFKFFLLVLLTDILALGSHFVCDHFSHTEYWQMGSTKYGIVLIDLMVFVILVVEFFEDSWQPVPVRMCVASGIFWAALPDGVWFVCRLFPETASFPPAFIKWFHGIHAAVHAPTPGWGLLNQVMIVVVALIIFETMTERRSS